MSTREEELSNRVRELEAREHVRKLEDRVLKLQSRVRDLEWWLVELHETVTRRDQAGPKLLARIFELEKKVRPFIKTAIGNRWDY